VNARSLVFVLLVFLVCALPAHGYGDPTGGVIFQTLAPILAMLWGLWMILANSIRRHAANMIRKLRGAGPDEPTP
jgi:hypothetical protein